MQTGREVDSGNINVSTLTVYSKSVEKSKQQIEVNH